MNRPLRPRCPICHFRQKDLASHQRKCEAAHRGFRKTWPKTTQTRKADRP